MIDGRVSLFESAMVLVRFFSGVSSYWLTHLSIFLIIPIGTMLNQVAAVELSLLNYGPSFDIKLNPESSRLSQYIRDELMTQRQSNAQMTIYDTSVKFARAEKKTLETVLHAAGYYRSTVGFTIVDEQIKYRVFTGPQYLVSKIEFIIPSDIRSPVLTDLGIKSGDPLVAVAVLDALQNFKNRVTRQNCLLTVDADYIVFIDHELHEAHLVFEVQPSPQVIVNTLRLSGLTSINENYLRNKIKIQTGDCFNRKALDKARLALLQSNLVATVDQTISTPVDGGVDVELIATERNHRTFKTGLGYNTDEKAVVSFGWEHRNLMGAGQKLNIGTRVSDVLQSVDGRFRLPDFGRSDQSFEFFGELSKEKRVAYETESITGGAVLTRELTKELTISAGVRLKLNSVLDQLEQEEYTLFSVPLSITWNTANDLLDPREGWIVTGQFVPYTDLLNTGTRFIKMFGSGSTYYTSDWFYGEPTFAVRSSVGSLSGATLNQVPADERYYVGGGGSVRGYPYQSLSAVDGNDPFGGRSFIEVSFETRFHHMGKWGSVLFVDGGFAESSEIPKWSNDLLWSAGLGIRYYTAAMPLRLDIAWPLHRRDGVDDVLQLYLSIGQAF